MSTTINDLNTTDELVDADKLVVWKTQAGATRAITAENAANYFGLSGGPYQPLDELLTAVAALGPVTTNGDFIQLTGQDTVRVRKLTVATYAALTAIAAAFRFDDMLVYVGSRAADGDGGDGWWRFDAASSATANGGTILAPDAGTGRWVRQYTGVLHSSWFATLQAGIDAAAATNIKHLLVDTDYTISAALTISTEGFVLEGLGSENGLTTSITMTSTGDIVTGSASRITVRRINFVHNQNSGKMVNLSSGEFHAVQECYFLSDNATNTDPAVYFRGSFTDIDANTFTLTGGVAARYCVECDRLTGLINIESHIHNNEFGGTCSGILIRSSDGSARPEGVLIAQNSFINTGTSQLRVEAILQLQVSDNVFDQTNEHGIVFAPVSGLGGVDAVRISNNWFGSTAVSTKYGIVTLSASSGLVKRLVISSNQFGFLGWGIADPGAKCEGVTIANNTFSELSDAAINLPETKNVSIIGNIFSDLASGCVNLILSDGSAGGPFYVAGNHFQSNRGETLTRTDVFKFTFDGNYGRKYSGRSTNTIDASTTGSGFVNVAHGLNATPSVQKVQATILEASGAHTDYYFRLTGVDATNVTFEVFWTTVSAGNLRLNVYAEI